MARAPKDKQVLSLAQGIVHWQPPPEAVQLAAQLLASGDASIHGYGPAEGLPPLRDALRHKIASRNGLEGYQVMVTAGANQAFVNLVLALCDSSDATVLFSPHYFNHAMALQMTGGAPSIRYGPCHPDTFHPNLDWLQQQLTDPEPPKMVVLVNPCNPTGVLLPREELQRAAEMTAAAGTWLILDNTYEDFVYDGRQHHAVSGPNVINLFSFSKAYGMMGWRVGYIAYPGQQLLEQGPWQPGRNLVDELLKVQDTIPICPSQLSQHVALAALQHGSDYITQQIANLAGSRALIADALSPLGSQGGGGWVGNEGAIYCWGKLPERFSSGASSSANGSSSGGVGGLPAGAGTDEDVVEWLIREHGVCVIPGSACGVPGCIRVAFANLKPAEMAVAAARLKAGLQQLVGMDSVVRA